MFRPLTRSHRRPPRRGTSFTLIVVVMVSIMAAVGSGFVLFAMREARLGLARKDSEGGGVTPQLRAPDPTDTVNRFFSALLFDTGDGVYDPATGAPVDLSDLNNGMRGHSIARSMYGRDVTAHSTALTTPPQPYTAPNTWALTTPWAGVGTFHEPVAGIPGLTDRAQVVNFKLINAGGGQFFLFDPEYTGQRTVAGGVPAQFNPTGRAYVGKHAGYSFPDLKDFFAGSVDPATGQVTAQSFHRDWLFGQLVPTNPNWTSPQGQFLTLRPRPAEHPNFPRVPPNADLTYTGDVQNWPGGYTAVKDPTTGQMQFFARNDSVWIDLGAPPLTLPGNRKVKPLVAALIVPVDGLFNASAHGTTYYGPNLGSYAGYGPWEVNTNAALAAGPNEAFAVAAARDPNKLGWRQRFAGATMPPGPTVPGTTRAYAPYTTGALPFYAPVAWNQNIAGLTFGYPNGTNPAQLLTGAPAFVNFQATNAPEQSHPSLFNPTEWSGSPVNLLRTFPMGDIKRMHRWGFIPDWYSQADVLAFAPTTLKGTLPFTFNTQKAFPANYNYRLDPAHLNRALFTTRSYDLDRPKVVPNFITPTLAMAGLKPGPLMPPGTAYPGPTAIAPGAPGVDFAAPDRWTNALAALGSVNLNRPLTDYRGDPTQPLSQANMQNAAQATADRQQLAADIFARLVAALGAAASVNPTTGIVTPAPGLAPGNPQYEALRYLAQLAVNIVDYIDNDDISTPFNWTGTEVVYGFEKQRLVINEAYSEMVNDPMEPAAGKGTDKATMDGRVRFFVELLNPTNNPGNQTGGPLGDGTVLLRDVAATPYQIVIASGSAVAGMIAPTNPTGTPTTPLLTYAFSNINAAVPVKPNNGAYNPNGQPAAGMALVGADTSKVTAGQEWDAQPTPPWIKSLPLAAGMTDAMEYTIPVATLNMADPSAANSPYKQNVVALRRLANPYAPAGPTNPYITVDYMDYVPTHNAVFTSTKFTPPNQRFSVGRVQPYAGQAQADPASLAAAGPPTYLKFPQSMTQRQGAAPASPNDPIHTFGRHNGTAGPPGNSTFTPGVPGGAAPTLSDTIMTPFDWLPHMDRPLVNQIELFQVRDTPSHMVTQRFITAPLPAPAPPTLAPTGVTYDTGVARWQYTNASPEGFAGLERALEYLTVRPFTAGVAHGGRAPGRISLNAMNDRRVANGLFDPQAANGFGYPDNVLPRFMDVAWSQWMASRNGVTQRIRPDMVNTIDTTDAPGQSVFDANTLLNPAAVPPAPYNQPFLSFGAPAAAPSATAFAYGAGGDENLTVLRRNRTAPLPGAPPLIYANVTSKAGLVYSPQQPDGPSYTQLEPLRKITNNATTVSHTYLVFLTVGYFDVNASGQYGSEAFIMVPGDMRAKFTAVVDMTGMVLDPQFNVISDPAKNGQPFFTSLENTARAGTNLLTIPYSTFDPTTGRLFVAADGQEVEIVPGSTTLVIGYGTEQQVVAVAGVAGPGQVLVTPLTRTAWAGTSVSNVRPGYPGPQNGLAQPNGYTPPNFSYTDPRYRSVLPIVDRLR